MSNDRTARSFSQTSNSPSRRHKGSDTPQPPLAREGNFFLFFSFFSSLFFFALLKNPSPFSPLSPPPPDPPKPPSPRSPNPLLAPLLFFFPSPFHPSSQRISLHSFHPRTPSPSHPPRGPLARQSRHQLDASPLPARCVPSPPLSHVPSSYLPPPIPQRPFSLVSLPSLPDPLLLLALLPLPPHPNLHHANPHPLLFSYRSKLERRKHAPSPFLLPTLLPMIRYSFPASSTSNLYKTASLPVGR